MAAEDRIDSDSCEKARIKFISRPAMKRNKTLFSPRGDSSSSETLSLHFFERLPPAPQEIPRLEKSLSNYVTVVINKKG